MKTFTPWFPANVKPVHVGDYEATAFGFYDTPPLLHWNGTQWMRLASSTRCLIQDREWRGLADKP